MTQKDIIPLPWHLGSTGQTELVMGFHGDREVIVAECGLETDTSYDHDRANADFIVKAANNHGALVEALRPFAWYFDVNDCKDRDEGDALEVPIRDLRIAFELFEALGLKPTPVTSSFR